MFTFVLDGALFTFQFQNPGLEAVLFQLPPTCRPLARYPCRCLKPYIPKEPKAKSNARGLPAPSPPEITVDRGGETRRSRTCKTAH